MEKTISVFEGKSYQLSSQLSFSPIIKFLKEKQAQHNSMPEKHLNSLLEKILLTPELTTPIEDFNIISRHEVLIGEMVNLVFSKSETGFNSYAVAAPFATIKIHSSGSYQNFFLTGRADQHFFEETVGTGISQTKLQMAYQLILNKYYGSSEIQYNTFVREITEPVSGVKKLIEIELVSEFIEVKLLGKLPKIDPKLLSQLFRQKGNNSFFEEELPLHLFGFEGVLLVKTRDVTVRESTRTIKNILLDMPFFGDPGSAENLQVQIQKLTGIPDVRISIASLNKKNEGVNHSHILDQHTSLLQPSYLIEDDSSEWLQIKLVFEERSSLFISAFSDSLLRQYQFLQSYADQGIKSLIMFPLKFGEELMGVFSVLTDEEGRLAQQHVDKIESLIPLFELAMAKQTEKMDHEIDKVIKDQFTAVQSSVNWKFTKAARNFIHQKNTGQEGKIENIIFENVFPLYGSIDVRNSSVERSIAVQKDLLDQLQLADAIIRKSKRQIYLFSLQEISFRIDKYIDIASVVLFPGDEMAIQNFLDEEITELFNHLKTALPATVIDIDNYFLSLNANTRKMSKQCNAYEESIAMINNELVKFIIQEQVKVQEIYAHYFEYFVTDGVDFNIYIGQSITPDKPFDQFYLKNLKLWQLTTLVKAAQQVRKLQDDISVPLDTTQLILAHSKPLSISFRTAERKFDVDGAYNMHYEIIKKRIDKIKIMGTFERLTQPGKIAIVFAHNKEAEEYTSYIEFLKNEGLLKGAIEYYDLEELPGIRGLKALRVSIDMGIKEEEEDCPLLITDYQLPAAG